MLGTGPQGQERVGSPGPGVDAFVLIVVVDLPRCLAQAEIVLHLVCSCTYLYVISRSRLEPCPGCASNPAGQTGMAEHSVPVSTGISDIAMPTEDGNEEVNPDPEHVLGREPNAVVAVVNDPVLPPTDVYTPTDSLRKDDDAYSFTRKQSFATFPYGCFSGGNTWTYGRSYRYAQRSPFSLVQCFSQSTHDRCQASEH